MVRDMLPSHVLQTSQAQARSRLGIVHTRDHVRCPACATARQTLTEATRLDPSLPFKDAAQDWLRSMTFQGNARCNYVAPRTLEDYGQYVDVLAEFFGALPLNAIHVGNVRAYQESRSATAGPNKINQELGILVRIMKSAGAWTDELEQHYLPLRHIEPDIPLALTPSEEQIFIEAAASDRKFEVVHWYALAAFATTAGHCEMRGLHLADPNLTSRVVTIRQEHAKNKYRMRTVPLVTDKALWAFESLIGRARHLGASQPEDHIFPFRRGRNGAWEFDRCMSDSGIKKPWDEVRRLAGLPWFCPKHCRHTAITRMAEGGVPIPTIMSMAGHMTRKMWEHYTSISEQAKRTALQNALGLPMRRARNAPRRAPLPAATFAPGMAATDALRGLDDAQVRELARIALAIASKVT